ncbi:MAG: serine/threonine protein kinase [Lachnospiraceae bacterium]|nr:serine/threonine protein kinase [Lachnospiraceae bacterium]
MSPQDKSILSFYRELEPISSSQKVVLVRHVDTGRICVKKNISAYNRELYHYLQTAEITGIPRIYECLDDGDVIVVIEQYISGSTLRQYLAKHGPMAPKEAKQLMRSLSDTLQRLHETSQPVVCRDLKPENVIMTETGFPVIVDFDSAKFIRKETSDTVLLGTPGYAAPEQFGFAASDERTDIYALGIMLNELLTGQLPSEQTAGGHLGKLVRRCISIDPKARPKSIREFRRQLDSSRWTPPGYRTRNTTNMLVGTVGYIANAAFTFSIWWGNRELDFSSGVMLAIFWLAVSLWSIAYGFDYMGIRTNMPGIRDIKVRSVRIIVYAVIWILGFFALGAAVAVGSSWIEEVFG